MDQKISDNNFLLNFQLLLLSQTIKLGKKIPFHNRGTIMMSLMSSKTAISSKTTEVRTLRLIIFVFRISVDLTNQASKCKVAKVVYKQDHIKKIAAKS